MEISPPSGELEPPRAGTRQGPRERPGTPLAGRIELDLVGGPDVAGLEPTLQALDQILRAAAGNGGRAIEVLLNVHDGNRRVALKPNRLKVVPEAALMDELERVLGPGHVRLVGRT